MLDLPEPIAVVAHDAGAANLLLGWLGQTPSAWLRPVMEGPAAVLWRRRFPKAALLPSPNAALDGAASVLTGTGWASDLEHQARRAAARSGLWSAAAIDHWVNYPARFRRNGVTVLPDELLVGDRFAAAVAARDLPGVPVRRLGNPYLAEQAARARPREVAVNPDILYVLEPARDDWGRGVPGEFQALDHFLARRDALGIPSAARLRLRLHPSEPAGKYDGWIAGHPAAQITLDAGGDLADAMQGAGWVVGCQSFALVIALEAGLAAISSLPPWAPPCRLPHDGLIHMKAAFDR